MLSNRQIEILSLIKETNEPITAEWIAKELNVSDRTVRNDIKSIQPECHKLGISIESFRGKGYKIHILDEELFSNEFSKMKREINKENGQNFSEQKDRVVFLLKRLLLEKESIKLEGFEEELYVSKSTMQNDLKIVKGILQKYNLKLVNRPHYGTQVEGEEYMKRRCLSNYIFNRKEVLVDLERLPLIDHELYKKMKEIIIQKVNEYKIEISDIALENLAIHIVIACKRIEEGFIIEHLSEELIDDHPFEKIVAMEIIKEIEKYTNLHFERSEIDYIIVHLLGTKLLHKENLTEFSEFDEVGHIVQCMLKRLKDEWNWDFEQDSEFIQALTLHIRPAMNRLRYKMNIRNPLLNEIKVRYPSAFEGAVVACKCIEEYISIEPGEDEIAYIALHIGVALERLKSTSKQIKRVIVVCASGVGSAKLLYYRLKHLFPNELEIVASINYYKLSEYNLSEIDLIISTIPIKETLGVPIQVVNTFLEEEDIQHIKGYLSPISKNGCLIFLDPKRIFLQQDMKDKESVISFLCEELTKQGYVTEGYEQLVLEREEMSPTSFGNLVAIPHPVTPVTKKTFWTICTLKQPITWNENQMVQFICLLNIESIPKGDLDSMYEKLIEVVENKSIVQRIIKSQSVAEVIRIFQEN